MSAGRGNPRVRVVHTSPNAPALDIYVDGSPAIPGLAFGQVSDQIQIPAGRHRLEAFPMPAGGVGIPLTAGDVEVRPGEDYTLAAVGLPHDLGIMTLLDSTPAPGPNTAKVRVLHASPDAPAMDLVVVRGPALFRGVGFRQATPWEEVHAGMVDLDLRVSGTARIVVSIPDQTLAGGNLYTFVALGLLYGTPGFFVLPIIDAVEMRLPV